MRAALVILVASVLVSAGLVSPPAQTQESRVVAVPSGTEWLVRLQVPLSSAVAKPDQPFDAGLLRDHVAQDAVVVPAGSVVRGFVSSVRVAGINNGRASLTLSFQELRIGDQVARLRASIREVLDPKMSADAERVNSVAVAGGGVVTGVLGGGSGALVGVVVTPGGALGAADGRDVILPVGTVFRIRLDQPVTVSVR